jgi:HEAT repeat protein
MDKNSILKSDTENTADTENTENAGNTDRSTPSIRILVLILSAVNLALTPTLELVAADFNQVLLNIRSSDPEIRKKAKEEFRRSVAARKYSQLAGDLESILFLRDVAENEKDEDVRNMAIVALSSNRDEATKTLVEKLVKQAPSKNSRRIAMEIVREIEGQNAVGVLKSVLKDDHAMSMRLKAAEELGKLGDESGYELGMQKLKDTDMFIRAWAANTLGSIGRPEAIPELEKLQTASGIDSGAAFKAIQNIRLKQQSSAEAKLRFLKNALYSKTPSCGWAAGKLSEMRTKESIQVLIDVARTSTAYDSVEYVAKGCAESALRGLYFDGTDTGSRKVEEMLKTGLMQELP